MVAMEHAAPATPPQLSLAINLSNFQRRLIAVHGEGYTLIYQLNLQYGCIETPTENRLNNTCILYYQLQHWQGSGAVYCHREGVLTGEYK